MVAVYSVMHHILQFNLPGCFVSFSPCRISSVPVAHHLESVGDEDCTSTKPLGYFCAGDSQAGAMSQCSVLDDACPNHRTGPRDEVMKDSLEGGGPACAR